MGLAGGISRSLGGTTVLPVPPGSRDEVQVGARPTGTR